MTGEEFLTIEEAASLIGRTPHAVYRLVARQQLPFRKHGKRLLFKKAELLAFLDALPGVTLDEIQRLDRQMEQ
jgi:excisionase family DNA binding protein